MRISGSSTAGTDCGSQQDITYVKKEMVSDIEWLLTFANEGITKSED